MNTGMSVKRPETFAETNGITQFRFSIHEVEVVDDSGNKTIHHGYDYVEIEGEVTRKKLIDALIRTKYDVNDEFNFMAKSRTSLEYKEYRAFVDACKAIVDGVLSA